MKFIYLPLAFCVLSAPVISQERSWTDFLSRDISDFGAAMGGTGSCSQESFNPQLPQVSLDLAYTDEFHRPLRWVAGFAMGNRTGPEPQVGFPFISVLACEVGVDAVVKAYSFEDAVFRVEIAYAECDRDACSRHNWNIKPFDTAFLAEYDAGLMENVTSEQVASFLDYYDNPQIRPIAKALNCTASWAWVGRSEYDRFRCLVSGSVENGVWTGAGAVEFFSPWMLFGETKHGRFATYLEFVDIERQYRASATVKRQIAKVVMPMQAALRDRLSAEEAQGKERQDILTTIQ